MRIRNACFLSVVAMLILGVSLTTRIPAVHAETATDSSDGLKDQIDGLNSSIKKSRSRVKELDAMIGKYKDRIEEQEGRQASLENEVLILDNRIMKKTLDIERAKVELEATRFEIQSLEAQIQEKGQRIERQKDQVGELIRQIHRADNVQMIQILVSRPSLSSFFDRLEEDKRVERDLGDALDKVQTVKQALEAAKKELDDKRLALEQEKKKLKKEELALEAERNFKTSLASETKLKQTEFERVLYELQQQQQSTADDISSLEGKLKDKLDAIDEALARGDVLLNWPVDPSRGITAKFHDPTYPFRNLFQHPGTDVRASVGTSITAAAGGYVAWNKLGRLYGNYVMLVHPGNIATVYAHLSKFVAKPDTYVERGDIIGKTGGLPGAPGAGLSTGPHLHFEVRQNGIPVDPENYLPSVNGEE